MSQVKFLSGLKSQLDAKADSDGLVDGALYFCTDEKKIFKAISAGEYVAVNEEVSYGALPEIGNAFAGKLYLDSKMTLYVKDGDVWKQLSAPADALDPSEDLNVEDDKKLVSKAAIKAGIQAEADRAKAAEKVLTDNLAAEVTRATNAETALGERIDALVGNGEGSIANQVGKVQDALDDLKNKVVGSPAEVNPENGTVTKEATGLFREIADEKAAREAEDAKLTKAIEDEFARAKAAEEANATAINNEKTRAEGAEAGLNAAIEAEAGRADAEEKRIVGLVEAEANRAKGEEARIEGLVTAETTRADAAEKANAAAIEAEANRATGKENELDQAIKDEAVAARAAEKANADEMIKQKDADQKGTLANQIKVEKEARIAADNGLDERLQAVEASIGDGGNLEDRVQANKDAIDVINGNGEGSIKKAVADLVNGAPEALDTLGELADALRDNKDVLTAIETAFDGKLATLQADVDQNEADCDAAIATEKQRAEGQEAAIRGEFAAADTKLKSDLQAEIDADVKVEKERAEAAEKAINDEITNMKNADLDGSLANLIADEAARAKAEEVDIRADFAAADAGLQTAIDAINEIIGNGSGEGKTVTERVEDIEGIIGSKEDSAEANTIYGAIASEKAAREEADEALDGRLDVVEAFVAAQPGVDSAQNDRIKALEDANKDGGAMKEAVDAAQDAADAAQDAADAAQAAADAAQADVDAVEKVIKGDPEVEGDKGLVGRIEANEAFVAAQPAKDQAQDKKIADLEAFVKGHDHTVMEAGIAANKAFVDAQPAVDKAQNDRIEALEGLFEGENSVDNKIAAAKAAAEAEAARLDGLLKTQLEGYADQAEADAIATAKAHTNDALTWGSF